MYLKFYSEYFHWIKNGEKTEEYRLFNVYWKKRLINRTYDRLIITRG
nr:ASCH domain-containing protein [Escherichia coli]